MNSLDWPLLELDFLAILTAFLFMRSGDSAAGVFAFGQGLFIDLFSGGRAGMFGGLYLCAFGVIYLACRFFHLHRPRGQIVIVSCAVLVKKLMFLLLVTVFSLEIAFLGSYLLESLASALITGLLAPPFFIFFKHLMKSSKETGE
jgi:rod shape-determining protein MreD